MLGNMGNEFFLRRLRGVLVGFLPPRSFRKSPITFSDEVAGIGASPCDFWALGSASCDGKACLFGVRPLSPSEGAWILSS